MSRDGARGRSAVPGRPRTSRDLDLDEAVAAGWFRADLRARLLGVRVELPPLREPPEYLGLLVGEMLARTAAERSPQPVA